jgi:hypothetical protein
MRITNQLPAIDRIPIKRRCTKPSAAKRRQPAAPSPRDSFVFPLKRKLNAAPNKANSNKNLITNPIYPPTMNYFKKLLGLGKTNIYNLNLN